MRDFFQFVVAVLVAMVEYIIAFPLLVADIHGSLKTGELQKATVLNSIPDFIYTVGLVAMAPFRDLFWVPDAPLEEQEELLVLSLSGMLAHSLTITAVLIVVS